MASDSPEVAALKRLEGKLDTLIANQTANAQLLQKVVGHLTKTNHLLERLADGLTPPVKG